MKKVIHNLRNRSEEDRKHILHVLLFACSILLVTLWIYSLGRSITSNETQVKVKQDLKPFTILKDSIVNSNDNQN